MKRKHSLGTFCEEQALEPLAESCRAQPHRQLQRGDHPHAPAGTGTPVSRDATQALINGEVTRHNERSPGHSALRRRRDGDRRISEWSTCSASALRRCPQPRPLPPPGPLSLRESLSPALPEKNKIQKVSGSLVRPRKTGRVRPLASVTGDTRERTLAGCPGILLG